MATKQIRISNDFAKTANLHASLQSRTTAMQIEHWARIGKMVEDVLSYGEIVGLAQGHLKIEANDTGNISVKDILKKTKEMRESGELSEKVVGESRFAYQSSPNKPGYIERIDMKTGKRETGCLENGEFVKL